MERLLRSVAAFHAGHGRLLQPHLESLAKNGQQPPVMVITCADSRILLDPLVNSEPGVVFAVRNVGNLVPDDDDASVSAAIEYAVRVLKVPDIVVMGHAECGAMKALLGEPIDGSIGRWLAYGRESVENLSGASCEAGMSEHDCLSQRNVLVQADRVRSMDVVRENEVGVHAWWWDMANARVLSHDGSRFATIEEAYAPELAASVR